MTVATDELIRATVERLTFAAWLSRLHTERFTGAAVVHFGEGVAHEAHVLAPGARVRFDKSPSIHVGS